MTYQYQPYPKWIDTADGRKLVHSEEEHQAHVAPARNNDGPTRNELVSQAEALGVRVDGRWSDARLAQEIESAK